jgi:HD superfamily phosphohydrolase YqeK
MELDKQRIIHQFGIILLGGRIILKYILKEIQCKIADYANDYLKCMRKTDIVGYIYISLLRQHFHRGTKEH